MKVEQTAQMVGYFYNKYVTSTGPMQVFQTCMRVGASLTDMTAGKVQLLKTGKWSDAIVTDMADGWVQISHSWMLIR